MDKRTLLALALMAIVLVLTPRLFPSSRRAVPAAADSLRALPATPVESASVPAAVPTSAAPGSSSVSPATANAVSAPASVAPSLGAATPRAAPTPATTTVVTTPRAEFQLVSPGAVPAAVKLTSYRDLRPGRRDTAVLAPPAGRGSLLHYRLAMGADTVALDTIPFTVQSAGNATTFTSANPAITISYETTPDAYRVAVRGRVANAPAGSALLIDLPSELQSIEADTLDDMRHLSYGIKRPRRDVVSVGFSKLDSTATRVDTGGIQWLATRNKYWLIALMKPIGEDSGAAFHGLSSRGGSYVGKVARVAHATTTQPLTNGVIAFDLYVGPQSWAELHALRNDLENVNPYGSFMRVVVQPFVTIVMRTLLWMKATLRVNYGWVLVIFGVAIRLLLWPLNQKAMRTSIQMQRLQPELTEIQKKYKSEPDKQRDALVKVYAAHGMSPLSPMLGCLPMLLPMPVLFALYFVFQNTIEFRGVQFLWLPDISLRDPYYIIPIVMGASMFLLSWIGMRGTPPNAQTKMMSYMMPVMFTVMFLNFASGLNLYYAIQNIAALPQQLILSRERAKAAAGTTPAPVRGGGGGGSRKT